MTTEIDPLRIDVIQLCQVFGGTEDIIHFPVETFDEAGVLVSTPQRWIHHDDPGLPERAG